MRKYFNSKVGVSGLVLSGVDRELNMIFVTLDNDTIGFSETKDKWIAFYDFIPEGYITAGDNLYTFKSGAVYLQNSGTVCEFFGISYDAVVDFFANKYPNINKIYNSLEIDSDLAWDVPLVEVQNKVSYNDMVSKIPSGSFTLREDLYHAPFLRNMKTTTTERESDLYEGEVLRGTNLYIKMTSDTNEEIRLFRVGVNSSVSKI